MVQKLQALKLVVALQLLLKIVAEALSLPNLMAFIPSYKPVADLDISRSQWALSAVVGVSQVWFHCTVNWIEAS